MIDCDTCHPGILRLDRRFAGSDAGIRNAYRPSGEWNIQRNMDRRAVHGGHRRSGALHAVFVRQLFSDGEHTGLVLYLQSRLVCARPHYMGKRPE